MSYQKQYGQNLRLVSMTVLPRGGQNRMKKSFIDEAHLEPKCQKKSNQIGKTETQMALYTQIWVISGQIAKYQPSGDILFS
jgi:hypothetical protein